MGFVAGLGVPTGMGVPTYYIDDAGNQWDKDTYATIIFDGSGSMNAIIGPLQNAMAGAYFSSGSAAGGDGIKNVDSIRSTVQDGQLAQPSTKDGKAQILLRLVILSKS